VVEYKGDAYATNDDSKEKRALGQLWEKRSNGKGLFLFAEKSVAGSSVASQLASKIC
jgi:type III restriction enzyme